jgi:hypothetical protein
MDSRTRHALSSGTPWRYSGSICTNANLDEIAARYQGSEAVLEATNNDHTPQERTTNPA